MFAVYSGVLVINLICFFLNIQKCIDVSTSASTCNCINKHNSIVTQRPSSIPCVPAVTQSGCVGKGSSHFRPESFCQTHWSICCQVALLFSNTIRLDSKAMQTLNVWERTRSIYNTSKSFWQTIIWILSSFLLILLSELLNQTHIPNPTCLSYMDTHKSISIQFSELLMEIWGISYNCQTLHSRDIVQGIMTFLKGSDASSSTNWGQTVEKCWKSVSPPTETYVLWWRHCFCLWQQMSCRILSKSKMLKQ